MGNASFIPIATCRVDEGIGECLVEVNPHSRSVAIEYSCGFGKPIRIVLHPVSREDREGMALLLMRAADALLGGE